MPSLASDVHSAPSYGVAIHLYKPSLVIFTLYIIMEKSSVIPNPCELPVSPSYHHARAFPSLMKASGSLLLYHWTATVDSGQLGHLHDKPTVVWSSTWTFIICAFVSERDKWCKTWESWENKGNRQRPARNVKTCTHWTIKRQKYTFTQRVKLDKFLQPFSLKRKANNTCFYTVKQHK